MPGGTNTKEVKVEGWVILAGRKFACSTVVVNYVRDGISTASATLAIGVDVNGGLAEINKGLESSANDGFMQTAQVYISLMNKPVKVFDGFLAGLAYSRQHGQVTVTVHMLHWLVALSFSTCVTDRLQSIDGAHQNTNAIYMSDAGAGGKSAFIGQCAAAVIIASGDADMGQVFIKIFKNIAGTSIITPGNAADCYGTENNKHALDALDKIVTSEGVGKSTGDQSFSGAVAAQLDEALNNSLLRRTLLNYITTEITTSYYTTGLWDKLVGVFAPEFKLSLIPLVDKALLVPFTPCLSKTGGTIKAEDIVSLAITAEVPRPVRAVAVTGGIATTSGANGDAVNTTGKLGYGCFSKDEQNQGAVLFVNAPGWLAQLRGQSGNTEASTGTSEGERKPLPSSTTPTASTEDTSDAINTAMETASGLYAKIAESIYYQEMLRGRRGSITTNLRWDIAPGSTISIETFSKYQPAGNNFEGQTLVATVDAVTLVASAESRQAYTTMQLSYCRTQKENEGMGTSKHPLYTNGEPFTGAELAASS